jgi:hypothetical protein
VALIHELANGIAAFELQAPNGGSAFKTVTKV